MEYGEEFQLTFSCHFQLSEFPFDSHECPIYFEDRRYSSKTLSINNITINYGKSWTSVGDDSLNLYDLGLPFEFELEAIPTKEMDIDYNYNVSQAGMVIKIDKRSLGQLLSGYYYPTTSFALLSMISFLINPDVVRKAQNFYDKQKLAGTNFSRYVHQSLAVLAWWSCNISCPANSSKSVQL